MRSDSRNALHGARILALGLVAAPVAAGLSGNRAMAAAGVIPAVSGVGALWSMRPQRAPGSYVPATQAPAVVAPPRSVAALVESLAAARGATATGPPVDLTPIGLLLGRHCDGDDLPGWLLEMSGADVLVACSQLTVADASPLLSVINLTGGYGYVPLGDLPEGFLVPILAAGHAAGTRQFLWSVWRHLSTEVRSAAAASDDAGVRLVAAHAAIGPDLACPPSGRIIKLLAASPAETQEAYFTLLHDDVDGGVDLTDRRYTELLEAARLV